MGPGSWRAGTESPSCLDQGAGLGWRGRSGECSCWHLWGAPETLSVSALTLSVLWPWSVGIYSSGPGTNVGQECSACCVKYRKGMRTNKLGCIHDSSRIRSYPRHIQAFKQTAREMSTSLGELGSRPSVPCVTLPASPVGAVNNYTVTSSVWNAEIYWWAVCARYSAPRLLFWELCLVFV